MLGYNADAMRTCVGVEAAAAAKNAIRVSVSTGNFDAGEILVFGRM